MSMFSRYSQGGSGWYWGRLWWHGYAFAVRKYVLIRKFLGVEGDDGRGEVTLFFGGQKPTTLMDFSYNRHFKVFSEKEWPKECTDVVPRRSTCSRAQELLYVMRKQVSHYRPDWTWSRVYRGSWAVWVMEISPFCHSKSFALEKSLRMEARTEREDTAGIENHLADVGLVGFHLLESQL